jgi:hypothetical protein
MESATLAIGFFRFGLEIFDSARLALTRSASRGDKNSRDEAPPRSCARPRLRLHCDQFFQGFLVRLQNDSGRTITATAKIPGHETQPCAIEPGETYQMTVSSDLVLFDDREVWNYKFENKGGATTLRCAPLSTFSPNVETWRITADGSIHCIADNAAQCQQPNGFPLVPSAK